MQSLQHASTLKGIGDDAAVIDGGSDHKKLISTDMLLEGVHFDLSYMPLTHLGYKGGNGERFGYCGYERNTQTNDDQSLA